MVAASSTYGCSLEHIWLQAVLLCCGTDKGEARTAGRAGRNAAGGGGGGGGGCGSGGGGRRLLKIIHESCAQGGW